MFRNNTRRKAQLGLDIREGGMAIPIANNMYYMDGRSHENGGIAIGPNNKNGLEVEGGEVIKVDKDGMKVYSSVPFLRGVSPAQLVMGGANPNKVFKAQEAFKDRNRINDDGTKYQNGGEQKIYKMPLAQRIEYQRTGRLYNVGYPITPLQKSYSALRALGRFRSTLKKTWRLDKALDSAAKGWIDDVTGNTYRTPKKAASFIKSVYNQFVGKSQERLGMLHETTEHRKKKEMGGEDTRSRNLRKLRNKFNTKGEYAGGQFGGSGAGSVVYNTPEYVTDTITKRYLVPVTQNFNDAFGDAVDAGLDKFMFNKKWYTTEKGNNPNNNAAGATRTQTIYLPVEHKEVRRRKKEFGGRAKAPWGLETPIKNGYYPKSSEPETIKWLSDWLNGRRRQLYENALTSPRHNMIYGKPFDLIRGITKGISGSRLQTNRIFYDLINNTANATHKIGNTMLEGSSGEYNTETKEITYPEAPTMSISIHERTHAMGNKPQVHKIKTILKDNYNKPWGEPDENSSMAPFIKYMNYYLSKPEEIYSRMMEYRYNSNLKPSDKVDINQLNNNRELLENLNLDYISDDDLINLFNNVADSNNTNKVKARYGGGMVYTINGNVKNGLASLRPKAQYGKEHKIKGYGNLVEVDDNVYMLDDKGVYIPVDKVHMKKPSRTVYGGSNVRNIAYDRQGNRYYRRSDGTLIKTSNGKGNVAINSTLPEFTVTANKINASPDNLIETPVDSKNYIRGGNNQHVYDYYGNRFYRRSDGTLVKVGNADNLGLSPSMEDVVITGKAPNKYRIDRFGDVEVAKGDGNWDTVYDENNEPVNVFVNSKNAEQYLGYKPKTRFSSSEGSYQFYDGKRWVSSLVNPRDVINANEEKIEGVKADYPKTEVIGSLVYKRTPDGKLVPTDMRVDDSSRYSNYVRRGINHPSGEEVVNPLTGEVFNVSASEDVKEEVSKGSTPRGRGNRAVTPTKPAGKPSFTTGEKPVTPTNPNEVRYANRVQKGNVQEDVKPEVKPRQTDTMTSDQLRYTRAAGFNKNAGTTHSSTGGGQQSSASETDERWIGQYNPVQTYDWIGLGANALGLTLSHFITQKALKNMPEPIKPIATPTVRLKRTHDINAPLTESREGELVDRATVARNTASSNTSLARQQRISNRARQERAGYYGQKENIETQLINQDRLNRQQQMARDVAAYNDYLNRVYASKRDVATQRASNINNLITGLTGSVNSMLSGIETRRMNNNTLRAIAAANPNVDARLIGGFDYYDVFGSNRRYDRHGNLIRR